MAKKHWIKSAIKHPGALHRELGVPAGEKIPKAKIEKAAHSDNPTLAKRAHLAETLSRMHHKEGGSVDETSSDLPENVQNFIHDTIMAERQHSPASHAKGGLVKRAMSRYSSKTVRRPA